MEKIDIIDGVIYVSNAELEVVKRLNLDELDVDLTYLEGCKLFTFNLTNPIKRVVKFTKLNDLNQMAEFVEYLYSDMTEQQKTDFDNFILLISEI